MSETFGSCPTCGTEVRQPKPSYATPEAEMNHLGVPAVVSVASYIESIVLDCGHKMRGVMKDSQGYSWKPLDS